LGLDPVYLEAIAFLLGAVILGIVFRVRRLYVFELILVMSVVVASAWFLTVKMPLLAMMPQGLDLRGGTRLVLQAVPTPEAPVDTERLENSAGIIRERVDRLGVSEPDIRTVPAENRIVVELPAVTRDEALDICKIAYLKFTDAEGNVIITGNDLKKATEQLDRAGRAFIHLELADDAKRRFAEATTRIYSGQSASRQIYIYLDQDLVSAPVVQAPNIEDPIIEGYESLKEAHRLATILNVGALPLQLEVIEVREVSASLGAESIRLSEIAAAVGIAAVMAFMLLFYRGAGVIADFALVVYGLLTLASLVAIRATLTLPGIAGLVLGVGMAVDANVLIYERIKDHLRAGRTLRAAMDSGFRAALNTIWDSNLTTLVAAAALWYFGWRFGVKPVQGFAVTLSVGIVISMLTAVVFSQYVLRLVINSGLVRKASVLFGEKEASLGGAR